MNELAPAPTVSPRKMRLSKLSHPVAMGFDSAKTSDDNRNHWADADGLSIAASLTPEVRRILRNRCRYEVANNAYARGITLTLANDVIGTGPRLQLLTGDAEFNRRAERDFSAWQQAINFPAKLRTMRMARAADGEAFAYLSLNESVNHPVKLDITLVEADRVCSPKIGDLSSEEEETDGIEIDDCGNPVAYNVLTRHPGDDGVGGYFNNVSRQIRAPDMVHFFRVERPGQYRGLPEITPALPLFAQLRRYTLAVLSAAEAAADFAGILYTDAPPNGETDPIDPMDKIKLQRNMLVTMPGGWKMEQVDPKQPASTYAEFKREILNEIARCMNMPYNVAAGNSSGYNYASGRLDHQTYFKSIRVDQHFLGITMLDSILRCWLEMYLEPAKPSEINIRSNGCCLPPHTWFWDGMEHVDPNKEANALATRLSCGATSYAAEFARQGKDFESEMNSQAKALGVSLTEYQALLRKKLFGSESANHNEPPGKPEISDEIEDLEDLEDVYD